MKAVLRKEMDDMDFLWIFYWLAIAAGFMFSCYCITRKHILSGTLQCILTIAFTYLSVQIGINSDYSGTGQTEFSYFLDRLFLIKWDAILEVVLLVLMIGCTIYHLAILQDQREEQK